MMGAVDHGPYGARPYITATEIPRVHGPLASGSGYQRSAVGPSGSKLFGAGDTIPSEEEHDLPKICALFASSYRQFRFSPDHNRQAAHRPLRAGSRNLSSLDARNRLDPPQARRQTPASTP